MALQKRGQLTIFIILGVVLLIASALIIYVQRQQTQFRPIITVPRPAAPVYDFVTSCISQVAEEGLRIQGLQGGYISIPNDIARNPTAYLSADNAGMFKMPYWFFEGQDRTPSLEQMQQELSKYVQDNLPVCIDNFSSFTDRFKITVRSQIKATTIVAPTEAIIKLDWIVDVTGADVTTTLKEFASFLPVRLKEIWDLANRTMAQENKQTFFENFTIDLLSANPKIPMDGMFVDCEQKKWNLADLKSEFKSTIYYNVPSIRIKNTQQLPFEEQKKAYDDNAKYTFADIQEGRMPKHTPADAYEYFRLQFDPGMYKTPLRAGFLYLPGWGMDFTGMPNDGGRLVSNVARGQESLSILCMNTFHFAYDVIYPVKMAIVDDTAFNRKGYTFQFAFPVLVDDNAASRTTFSTRKFTGFEQSTGFCQDLAKLADIRAIAVEPGRGEVELDEANISYRCVRETCDLGQTTADQGYYRLRTPLPTGCTNPFVSASKEGYLTAESQFTGEVLELKLKKMKKFNVEIVRHPYASAEKQWLPAQALAPGENATVRLSIGNYDQFIQAPGGELDLVEGNEKYDIDVMLTLFHDLVGGYHAENISIKYEQLADKNTIVFHVFEYRPITRTEQYYAEVASFLSTGEYQNVLKVEFR